MAPAAAAPPSTSAPPAGDGASSGAAGAAAAGGPTRDAQHTWEETDAATLWSSVQEDADGNLISSTSQLDSAALVRLRRQRLAKADYARSNRRVVRDMIRYLYLVVDLSRTMNERDPILPPSSRLDAVLNLVGDFVSEYYDQNPLSHLGIVVVRDGEAEMLTRLTGSRTTHALALANVRREANAALASDPNNAGGEFSLQNGLEVAGRSLGHMPRYGSREIVVLMGSLSTCDPGDVLVETLPKLRGAAVRVSCIALSAEVHVCRKIADETGGMMGVCLDKQHLRDLMMGQCVPPPARPEEVDANGNKRARTCEFVQMGFPSRRTEDVPSLIHAGASGMSSGGGGGGGSRDRAIMARTGYLCPRCKGKCAELPADCAVCGLKLVLAPHLARSFHHLFPVSPFVEVPEEVVIEAPSQDQTEGGMSMDMAKRAAEIVGSAPLMASSDATSVPSSSSSFEVGTGPNVRTVQIDATVLRTSADCDRCCFACLKVIGVHEAESDVTIKAKKTTGSGNARSAADPNAPKPERLRFQCPDCRNVFCADCDAYLHETVHNCPGCLCGGGGSSS